MSFCIFQLKYFILAILVVGSEMFSYVSFDFFLNAKWKTKEDCWSRTSNKKKTWKSSNVPKFELKTIENNYCNPWLSDLDTVKNANKPDDPFARAIFKHKLVTRKRPRKKFYRVLT